MSGHELPVTVSAVGGDGVAVVEFARGPANFFDYDLLDAIARALQGLADDTAARAVVLCSSGRHFCAGADLAAPDVIGRSLGPARHIYDPAARIFDTPLPLVAAVQGGAVGGGLGLALAADFRVAATTAWFHAPFTALGLTQGFGLTATLPRAVGHQTAQELLLTARRVDADEALRLGLADRVVAPEHLLAEARALAASIAANAPQAVRAVRALLRGDLADQARAAMARERVEQTRLARTTDHAEGVAASIERRTPSFTGR